MDPVQSILPAICGTSLAKPKQDIPVGPNGYASEAKTKNVNLMFATNGLVLPLVLPAPVTRRCSIGQWFWVTDDHIPAI